MRIFALVGIGLKNTMNGHGRIIEKDCQLIQSFKKTSVIRQLCSFFSEKSRNNMI